LPGVPLVGARSFCLLCCLLGFLHEGIKMLRFRFWSGHCGMRSYQPAKLQYNSGVCDPTTTIHRRKKCDCCVDAKFSDALEKGLNFRSRMRMCIKMVLRTTFSWDSRSGLLYPKSDLLRGVCGQPIHRASATVRTPPPKCAQSNRV